MHWLAERGSLRTQTRDLLRALGDDATQVATSLNAQGVKGRPHSPQGCAIAVYVAAIVGADRRVRSVTVNDTRLHIRSASRYQPPIVVHLPRAAREFIAAFDAERFPRLYWNHPSRPRDNADPNSLVTAANDIWFRRT